MALKIPNIAAILPVSKRTKLGPVAINVIVTETHTRSVIITRAPVEGEADRSQFIITEPRTVSISGIISPMSDSREDQPVLRFFSPQLAAKLTSGIAATANPDGPAEALARSFESQQAALLGPLSLTVIKARQPGIALDNYNTAWARWNQLIDSKELFDYVSLLGVYRNMFVEFITIEKDEREAHFFTADLIEFRTAGVNRDRWLTDDILDDARDGASVGTRTPVDSEVDTSVSPSPLPDVASPLPNVA